MENSEIVSTIINNITQMNQSIGNVCAKMDSIDDTIKSMKSSFDTHIETHEEKIKNLEDKAKMVEVFYKSFKKFSGIVITFIATSAGFFGITNFNSILILIKKMW